MSDAKYFSTTKKGELVELQAELHSDKRDRRKDAVKKVIASMTVGKDVSSLFPDVLNCMQTDNLELKKLVYLYVMNYAKSQPDVAIMAVNTFVNDCRNDNPLIRALAIRTMGCIRVRDITEYVLEPLRRCLKDQDPYVRKTAAVCVAKLYDIDPEQTESSGFIDDLRDLLADPNPMVVANAVASLSEINETSGGKFFQLNAGTLNKLLTALNECTEWGQIFILDSLAVYDPRDGREAQSICERVTPRLSHANGAVVLSAVKVLMKYMEQIEDPAFVSTLCRKLAPPLISLLSTEAEIKYVALRNINLVVQKRPDILKNEMKVFFVQYNDPIYVKMEKLDIMIRLAAEHNVAQVLAELKEYATEVDVDFVRKSVRAIGRCAIKIEPAAEQCIQALLDLIQTKVNYVVQEAIVVIKDIFRKYPNRYESIIANLCENLETLDEPEAKASMIWIVGEYAERIDNAASLLGAFLDSFPEENAQVQLQLLSAIVKLFLKAPNGAQEMVQKVLQMATQDSDNPDLRDRGYIYWRLLSSDPAAAKTVVLGEKPLISDETDMLEPGLLNELICHIGSLASVYHKPPSTFVEGKTPGARRTLPSKANGGDDDAAFDSNENEGALGGGRTDSNAPTPAPQAGGAMGGESLLDLDLTPQSGAYGGGYGDYGAGSGYGGGYGSGGFGGAVAPAPAFGAGIAPASLSLGGGAGGAGSGAVDLLGGGGLDAVFGGNPAAAAAAPAASFGRGLYSAPKATMLAAAQGKGLEVSGTFARRGGEIFLDMTLSNRAMQPMSNFAIQFNKNSFGLQPAQPLNLPAPIPPNQSTQVSLPLTTGGVVQRTDPLNAVQIAVKNNVDVFVFTAHVLLNSYFGEDGEMERSAYLSAWKEIPDTNERKFTVTQLSSNNPDTIQAKLGQNNISTIAKRTVEGQDLLYLSAKLTNGLWVLFELCLRPQANSVDISVRTRSVELVPLVEAALSGILRS
ncbi:adaptor-like protein complex 1 beta 1 subunit [Capsaspora owczarzaki ATCC 30864]|uniref:AP complex subunit beta n=1 Tax=Capsaspora owczarzaki (strain ATCC 30864) TaxID=595528 RepID=A0A0D2UCE9_CAPO3|nr:adaptor-like protein complex 1 beta 1 subunit [Capsaspora owczarzaki ATCC 30864]KJE92686.1 adaptor-like protein complex 1 beta 1 subunit [Capsaspora owczarzaki ATCC 30864]|eukprot:XP_004363331.1 adaptor-like protein complex 1 beta 1 subunit [Capsaspora owczarzaki ATCC 30864]